jgi:hypothetical protein
MACALLGVEPQLKVDKKLLFFTSCIVLCQQHGAMVNARRVVGTATPVALSLGCGSAAMYGVLVHIVLSA